MVAPRDTAEAAAAIVTAQQRGSTVRPLGARHSFSAIGSPGSGCALDLRHWSGIVHADPHTRLVTVRAGTRLSHLNAELDQLGLAVANLGDIDQQTIAGAISTGTHGTGAALGGLATQVEALELLLADGTELRCSTLDNPEIFSAARVGLGALGVITTVTLRCVPAFTLATEETPAPLQQALEDFDQLADDNEHFSFYWFPHSTTALIKRSNRHSGPPEPLSPARQFITYDLLENRVFDAVCRLGRGVPAAVRPLNRFCARMWSGTSFSDRSDRVLTAPRRVRFVESEFAVPRAAAREVLGELRELADGLDDPVMFPVEVRLAAPDDAWLSMAYGRATAYIGIHQFRGMPYRRYFDGFQDIAVAAGGRPHWGKLHSLDAADLRERYPRFAAFGRVRASLDPSGVFGNDYLDQVLGT